MINYVGNHGAIEKTWSIHISCRLNVIQARLLSFTSFSLQNQTKRYPVSLKIPSKMQCIRSNENPSPALTPIQSTVSLDSLNEYLTKRLNRKSLMRRSFEFVRKSFVRQSQYLFPKHGTKVRNLSQKREISNNDLNNNGSSSNNSQILAQTTNTYCNGGEIFVISADSDILASNTIRRKRLRANVRWVFQKKPSHKDTLNKAHCLCANHHSVHMILCVGRWQKAQFNIITNFYQNSWSAFIECPPR